jgi:hypothetical protein
MPHQEEVGMECRRKGRAENQKQINETIMKVPMYTGLRIKDGSLVAGYVAIGGEGNTAWIMAPTVMSDDQFRMFNVDPESLRELKESDESKEK